MAHKPNVAQKDELAAQMYYSMLPSLDQKGLDLPSADHTTGPYMIPRSDLPKVTKSSRSARLCDACLRMNVHALYTKGGYKHLRQLSRPPAISKQLHSLRHDAE